MFDDFTREESPPPRTPYGVHGPLSQKAVTLARIACTSRMGAVAAHEVWLEGSTGST